MLLSTEEKDYINRISIESDQSKKIVQQVLFGVFINCSYDLMQNNACCKIDIPYICKLKIDPKNVEIELSKTLLLEIDNIENERIEDCFYKPSYSADRIALDQIVATSGQQIKVVKNVLKSFAVIIAQDIYSGYAEFLIPYIGKVFLNYNRIFSNKKEQLIEVKAQLQMVDIFNEEINCIFKSALTPSQKMIQFRIEKRLEEILCS